MIPGEYFLEEGDIEANVGRATAQVTVANTGDRPIQVGSHYHFFEANKALESNPALINTDPYGEGWIYLLKVDGAGQLEGLQDATAYKVAIG